MTRSRVDVPPDAHAALETLSLLSKKWQPVVIVALDHHGPVGFNDLLEVIPDVSGKVLSETLETLVDADLVERTVISESPLRVEYDLTSAGADMDPIFDALAEWGSRHLETSAPTVLIADGDRRLTDMYAEWLSGRYAVARAYGGREIEERLEDDPDVVVFEWGVGTDPDDILDAVDGTCRTIVLVGDRPQFDLLTADCDDVLRKPIVRKDMLEAIDAQVTRRDGPDDERQRVALAARLSFFESIYSQETLESNATYVECRSRLDSFDSRDRSDSLDGDVDE